MLYLLARRVKQRHGPENPNQRGETKMTIIYATIFFIILYRKLGAAQ